MRRRRKRHPLWRLLPSWLRRKPGYKDNHALHEYEDRVLLALVIERGQAAHVYSSPRSAATEWSWREPGRWDLEYLTTAFKRLGRDRHGALRMAAQGTPSHGWRAA